MSLNKIESTQLGQFGKLTSAGHAKADKSIFGNNCGAACSYEDSFGDLSVKDGGAFDIFSTKGKQNLENTIKIIKNEDKPQKPSRSFEMNAKAYDMLREELGADYVSKSLSC